MLANRFIPRLLCALTLLLVSMVGAGTLYAQPAKPLKTEADSLLRTELVFWESIKDSTNPDEFEAYLSAYPDGHFASLARIRMQTLKDKAGISASSTAQRQQPVSSLGEKVGAKSGNSGCLEPGKVFRDCDVCPALVVIPSGHFEKGVSM